MLNLVPESKVLLTVETRGQDPNDTSRIITVGQLCGLDGKPLAAGQSPVPTYLDSYTGKRFALVAEVIPSANDAASLQRRKDLLGLQGIEHYASADGQIRGYFVPSPDFTLNGIHPGSKKPAAAKAADLPPNPAA